MLAVSGGSTAQDAPPEQVRHVLGRFVEKGQVAFIGKFKHRVGIEFRKRSQLLDFRLRPLAIHRHGQCRGDGQEKVDLLLREYPLTGGINPQDAERSVVALNDHRHTADDAMFGQKLGNLEARFLAQIRNDHRFAGEQV